MELELELKPEITIPIFCKTGNTQANSDWGNDELWEIVNKTVSENQLYKNSDDFDKGDCYFPITFGTKKCYTYVYPNLGDVKIQNRIQNIDELETMIEHLTCEDQTFWDYFLEEENFRKLIEFGKGEIIPSRKEMYLFLPPEIINYNRLPEDYKTTIHQQREMTIRSDIHFGYQHTGLQYLIKNSLKSIYIGVLEYSGYKECDSSWLIINDEITFVEHEILGLEIG